ncbi:hypothetical protein M231_07375 [Tremella mesenterica]|uniref:Argonaute n=1 Tax=Tremella mesenterica TaxID=5217 RepID=A0A4Q1BFT9_TREME|nr:hypothetical protein M231_07375 [Tremella mesenterica]
MPPKGRADAGVEAITSGLSLSQIGGGQSDYAPRPGVGRAGRPITVSANMYQVRFKTDATGSAPSVYHYDVEISPVVKVAKQKKPPRALLWKIWQQMLEQVQGGTKRSLEAAAFDQVKSMYTPIKLFEGPKLEVIVNLVEDGKVPNDDKRRFRVVFQEATDNRGDTKQVDLQAVIDFCKKQRQTEMSNEMALTGVQATNVLMRQDVSARYTPVGAQGRRFFSTEGSVPISSGCTVYKGFTQSFRPTASGLPAIQLDTAYSAFINSGPLIVNVADSWTVAAGLLGMGGGGGGFRGGRGGGRGDFRGGRGRGGFGGGGGGGVPDLQQLNRNQISKLNKILRNAKFTLTHRQTERVFSCKSLTFQSADELQFLLNGRDGGPDRMVKIPQYFKETYNVTVTKPRLPCVMYGQKNYVPLEFVRISEFNPMPFAQQTSEIAADMIRIAAKPPAERLKMIQDWRAKLNYSELPKIKAWGMQVQNQMLQAQARILPGPQVQYAGGKTVRQQGQWNLASKPRFFKANRPLESWSIANFDPRLSEPELSKSFLPCPLLRADSSGVIVTNKDVSVYNGSYEPFKQTSHGLPETLQTAARMAFMKKKVNPQLIFVIMPKKDTMMYQDVKRYAASSLKLPVPTQCMQGEQIRKNSEQYKGNMAMKVHMKLGGVTHVVKHQKVDATVMIMGADVSHPPNRGANLIQPSIAVTVATENGENVKYTPCLRLQDGRTEIIRDLQSMTVAHLKLWRQNSKGALPKKIYMFRDGVSEGQYGIVVREEVQAIKAAAHEIQPEYRPAITFVVCAKRHSMRFFATRAEDTDQRRNGNLQPGTVVDTAVVHPYAFDFYLQAHAGIQGTAKPTHYIVVHDDNKFDADAMQTLVHDMCYSYGRATLSVSLIPPAYIIAAKARDFVYVEDPSEVATTLSAGETSQSAEYDPLALKKRIEDTPSFHSVAWYM